MAISTNLKNSLLLIIEKVFVLGLAFLNSVLLARVGGVEVFGQYSYITSYVGLFAPLCVMGLNNISTKYFVKYPRNSHHYFLSVLSIRLLGGLACIFIGGLWAYYSEQSYTFLLILVLLVMQSFTLFYVVEFYFLAQKQVKFTQRIRLGVLIVVGVSKAIVILNGADLTTLIILHGLEFSLIGIGYLALYYGKKKNQLIRKPFSTNTSFALFHKGKWLLLSGVAAAIYLKIDQVMLAKFSGIQEVAYYAAAVKLSEFWYVFPLLIANAYNPSLIKIKHKGEKAYYNFILKLLSVLVACAVIICLIFWSFSDVIISIIYGQEYGKSAQILTIHIVATIFIFQRAVLSKWLILEKLYRFSLITHGLGAVTNVLLNIWLIPLYGGLGAAWATLIAYTVASFLSLILYKQTRLFMMLMCNAMLKWPYYVKQTIQKT